MIFAVGYPIVDMPIVRKQLKFDAMVHTKILRPVQVSKIFISFATDHLVEEMENVVILLLVNLSAMFINST
jgi:hypothetical protein